MTLLFFFLVTMDPLLAVGIALSVFVVFVLMTAYLLKMASKLEAAQLRGQIPDKGKNDEEPGDTKEGSEITEEVLEDDLI